ncbi:hypothetical protein HAZT_HAZT010035 [Hyalella azteca]|uniref:G-protein coupled receptors family 1 profile domain-containing protein n=1 Tax=Hyalella azteca TaxID=294128 RepID=A0A6A0H5N8_HYAAZ|nr:hypothetical protein HAZT_HAZT010035 [Hyalella azteca]
MLFAYHAVSVSVSAWTLVAISHERYSGICRPLRSRGWRTASHARKRIAVVWISSLVFMAPIAITSTLMPVGNTGPLVEGSHGKETDALIGCEERKCAGNDERRSGQTKKLLTSKQHSEEFQANSSRTILVPGIGIDEFDFESSRSSTDASGADGTGKPKFSSIVIHKNRGPGKFKLNKSKAPSVEICLSETVNDAVTFSQRFNPTSKRNKNVRITQKRTRENQIINHETSLRSTSSHKALRDKQRMIKMIGVVVLEFFICWTPLYVLNTVSLYNGSLVYRILGMKGVAGVHLLAYCSACCNPITYCFMSRSFRSAFYSVVQCRKLGVRKSLDVMS